MRPICSLFVLAIACNPGTAQEAAPARQQHFSGHALDTRGRPLEGVEVRLLDERAGLVGEVLARTGGDGAFALELPALASESSLDAAWSTSVLLSRRGKATIGIRPFVQWATPLRDANVVMPAGITMRGVVRDPSGAPLEGARIIAKDATSFRRLLLGTEAFGTGDQSPEATCVARSDAAGSFELRGVLPSGTRLLVSHAGHATRATPPVSAGDELAIVLEPTGFARGTLVDADGAPQAGHLILLQESGIFRVTDVGPGGAFEIPLESTGDFALLAMPDSPYSTEEPLLDPGAWRAGPADDLRVVVQSPGRPPADPAEASAGSAVFPIRVIDATTGAPIAGARGAVIWEETILELDLAITQLMGWGLHFEGDATGTIRARGPSGDDDERGLAFAIAPGYAPCRAEAKWDPKGGGLELKMAVGAIVSGHVIDASTGAPVANAPVIAVPGAVACSPTVSPIGRPPIALTA